MYVSGFCSSFLMKPVNRSIGRNVSGQVGRGRGPQKRRLRTGAVPRLAPAWLGAVVLLDSVLPGAVERWPVRPRNAARHRV